MISRTSPSASAYGLPISSVTMRASRSAFASTSRPMVAMARPRIGAGTSAHFRWASVAARQARAKVSAEASVTSATTWSR